MGRQWHPLFTHLLGLLLGDYYEVHPEVPVSDLPRAGDILLLRRQSAQPPFRGLWERLTEWNVLEFKGPTDDAEEEDLERLIHVGTGITSRLNEERQKRGEERLANRQVSFWYLAPKLGETFLGHTRTRAHLDYQTGGLWKCSAWGHPIWLVAYRDSPVEVDTIPLHLLDREPAAPRALGELVLHRDDLLRRFAAWLMTLQPDLWEEIRIMAATSTDGPQLDWARIGEFTNLDEVVRILPPERVLQILGIERTIAVFGLDRLIAAVGLPRLVESVGLPRFLEALEPEKVLDGLLARSTLDQLLARIPLDQLREMLGRREKQE